MFLWQVTHSMLLRMIRLLEIAVDKEKMREDVLAKNASTTLEKLFSQIREGERELNLIIQRDVQRFRWC